MKLQPTDLWILLLYVVGILAFGLWIGRHNKNASDYALGGRNLPWWAVLLSIVATETSTVTFLSVPGVAYLGDLRFLQLPLGFAIGRLLVTWLLLPGYFRGKLFTAYEVLEHQLGGATKPLASLLFLVTRTLGDGLRLFLSALVLWKVTGIPQYEAILWVGAVTMLYTFVGGMRAVIWTDCIQFGVYMIGAVIALFVLFDKIPGGMAQVFEVAEHNSKLRVFDFDLDLTKSYALWAGLFGGAFVSLGSHGADQLMVQRYLCARSQRQAGLALILSGPIVFLQFGLFLLVGIALYAFYSGRSFDRGDEVFATFIVQEMPVGLVGIVLGAVFSAAMSTLSSSLNSSATSLVRDLRLPFRNELWGLRFATLLFGFLQIGVALLATGLPGDTTVVGAVLAIQSFATGVLLGLFFLGLWKTRLKVAVDGRAAAVAMFCGLVLMSFLAFGTKLAWPWFAVVGSIATLAFGLLAAAVLRQR